MGKHTKKSVDIMSKSKNKDQTKIKRFFNDTRRQQLQREIEDLYKYQTDFEKIHQSMENLSKPEILLHQGDLGVHVKGINDHVNGIYDHFKANFKVSGNLSKDHINALKSINRAFNVILDESVNCYIDSMTEKFDGLDRLKTTVMVTINTIKENSEKIQNSALIALAENGHGAVTKKINGKVASGSSHSEEPQKIIDLCSDGSPSTSECSTLDVGGQSRTGQQDMIIDGVPTSASTPTRSEPSENVNHPSTSSFANQIMLESQQPPADFLNIPAPSSHIAFPMQAEVQPIFTGNTINGLNPAQFIGAMHPRLESQPDLNAAFAAQTAFQQGPLQRQTISPIQLAYLQQMFNSMNPAQMNHQQMLLYQIYQGSQFGRHI